MLRHFKSYHLSHYALLLIAFILFFTASNTNWGDKKWQNTLESDAKGYYAYNPAVFIYHDLNFLFFKEIEQEKYFQEHLFVDYRSFLEEGIVNKYYAGTALLQSPFFLTAHLIASPLGYDTDGYSKIYMQFVNIAAIFYCLVGLLFIGKTLNFYHITELYKGLTYFILVFGTNLFVYTVVEPGMSHVYSFVSISAFVYAAHVFFYHKKATALIWMGLLLGLICLIRPVNGLIVFSLFFIAQGQVNKLFSFLFKHKKKLTFGTLAFLLIVSIQSLIYYISTEHFWVYSYRDEGFNFLSPHLFDILLSYKKGLFLYTPIYLLSLVGLFVLAKESVSKSIYWVLFFVLITYIFSSWWMWYYGASFSSRVYVEYLPLFAILLSMALNHLSNQKFRKLYLSFCVILTLLCQIQTYQYRYNIIHYSEMTQEQYWNVFLKIK